MIHAFDSELVKLARLDEQVVIIGADDGRFRPMVPEGMKDRYLNVGIAECNAIGVAAGLSCCNKIPFVTAGGTFLVHRANEFIRDDVCMQNRNVKMIAVGAGLAMNALGNTQHMTEDVATLRAMPNLTIMTAATPREAVLMARAAYEVEGPVYIRLGRHEGRDVYQDKELKFQIGKAQLVCEGRDISIITSGTILSDVLDILPELDRKGICAEVINMHTIKPIDRDMIIHAVEHTGKILVVEEHSVIGGLRGAIAEVLTEEGIMPALRYMGLNDCFARGYGSYKDIKRKNGLSLDDIIKQALRLAAGN